MLSKIFVPTFSCRSLSFYSPTSWKFQGEGGLHVHVYLRVHVHPTRLRKFSLYAIQTLSLMRTSLSLSLIPIITIITGISLGLVWCIDGGYGSWCDCRIGSCGVCMWSGNGYYFRRWCIWNYFLHMVRCLAFLSPRCLLVRVDIGRAGIDITTTTTAVSTVILLVGCIHSIHIHIGTWTGHDGSILMIGWWRRRWR